MAGPFDDPSSGFAPMAAAVAGGAQAFTQAYGARQQQVHTMQNQDQELAMKKQYYELQMAKLRKESQPTKVDMQNVMTNVYKFRAMQGMVDKGLMTPEDFQKASQGLVTDAETPGEASAYAKLLNMGGDQARYLTEEEAKISANITGQYAVGDRIASQERQTGLKIRSQQEIEMAKRLEELQKQNLDYETKLKEFGYKDAVLDETRTHNRAMEGAAHKRADALKNRPTAKPRDPYIDNLSRRLLNAENAVTKGKKKTDMLTNRADKIAAQEEYENNILLRDTLQKQFDEATGRGKKSAVPGQAPAASGAAPARQAPQGSFMGGMGPARIYELTEAKSAPDGALVRSNGVMYRKNAKTNKLEKVK